MLAAGVGIELKRLRRRNAAKCRPLNPANQRPTFGCLSTTSQSPGTDRYLGFGLAGFFSPPTAVFLALAAIAQHLGLANVSGVAFKRQNNPAGLRPLFSNQLYKIDS